MKRSHLFFVLGLCACGGSPGGVADDVQGVRDEPVSPVATLDSGSPERPSLGNVEAGTPSSVDSGQAPCQGAARWWHDRDGDGYGDMVEEPASLCGSTTGYVTNGDDCADADPLAHPGQTSPQSLPVVGVTGTRAFDFDCDGIAEPWRTGAGACFDSGSGCHTATTHNVWQERTPACGQAGVWIDTCGATTAGYCRPATQTIVQRCL